MFKKGLASITLLALFLTSSVFAEEHKTQIYHSYQDILVLYKQYNYTPEAWQAGVREAPRLYFTSIPESWSSKTSKEITVANKKRLFFRGLAPLVLRANELIIEQRKRFLSLTKSDFKSLKESDKQWLLELARSYKVLKTEDISLGAEQAAELAIRVDVIPVSLALAQGAVESGWGTSRFATQGNSLFGQWTWGDHAMKPSEQRKHLGNYGLAAFESPLQSVVAYMQNLNTHAAYQALREIRSKLRAQGKELTGTALANGLVKYSEKGQEYVELLHSMIRHNHLAAADSASLTDMEPIYLVPAKHGQ
ncbi:glucosaminidase domain-containing protein [Agaribacterium sp. ZY112]|uniref:glucosaminidase domain-containing protein n=1 Tax=Agaribacterium sp. ZY112 TaxID=3233574 RepID=UPI0035234067